MKLDIDFTERELAIICDALWSHATCMSYGQPYEKAAAPDYNELGSRISDACKSKEEPPQP